MIFVLPLTGLLSGAGERSDPTGAEMRGRFCVGLPNTGLLGDGLELKPKNDRRDLPLSVSEACRECL